MSDNDYIIEFVPHGRFVKVSAIDPNSGKEAVIVGDAAQPPKRLAQQAVNKLEFLLKKPK